MKGPTVAVTGVGLVTPHGVGVETTWAGALEGRSAVARIRRFDPTGFDVTFAAEAPDPGWPAALDPAVLGQGMGLLAHDLKGRLTAAAVLEALAQAGLPVGPPVADPRLGVWVGSEAARPPLAVLHDRLRDPRAPDADELLLLSPDAPTRLAAALVGAAGPRRTISTACTSSSQAVGEGALAIQRGEVDAALVGGVDVLVDPIMLTGFSLLGALSTRNEDPAAASRPFDQDRDGFVLGEGAGFLVLERLDRARARGAAILGIVSGYGCSCNAWRITDSPPDGRGAALSMQAALDHAGLRPDQVGYLNAHGTSTAQNDQSESAGVHRVFGPHAARLPVSSTKGGMGHLVAACGAVEVILCLLALRDGLLPPTVNLDRPDPLCALDHVRGGPRPAAIHHAMSNAFGFGGSNGTVIVSAPAAAPDAS